MRTVLNSARGLYPPVVTAQSAPSTAPAVAVSGLVMAYGDRTALTIDELEIARGTITTVIGPNGSGKSTFLAAISGLVKPRRGTVTVLGSAPGHVRASVAHVLQETRASAVVPLTVHEVVRMGRYARRGLFGRFTTDDHGAVERALARLAIGDLRDRQLTELSGGQRQRVYVAQGLAQEAEVLLLDEPATGLDIPSQERIGDVVREESAAGRTVISTTHSVAEAVDADNVVLLAGRLIDAGGPATVLRTSNLSRAYGGHVHVTPTGAVVVDDPHHAHAHGVEGR